MIVKDEEILNQSFCRKFYAEEIYNEVFLWYHLNSGWKTQKTSLAHKYSLHKIPEDNFWCFSSGLVRVLFIPLISV